jgi:hypothetical protein
VKKEDGEKEKRNINGEYAKEETMKWKNSKEKELRLRIGRKEEK